MFSGGAADADQGADRRLVAAEPAGERRADLGVAEIEFGGADCGLIHCERRLGLAQRAGALVEGVLGEVAALGQLVPRSRLARA